MAGHKAASAAATWPDINGYLVQPPGLYKADHGWLNFIDNKIMVHFVHRGLAYLLLFPGAARCSELASVFATKPQLLIVASPPRFHVEQVLAALAAVAGIHQHS